MRTTIALVLLLLGTQVVRAERSATVNLGGMIGGIEHRVDEATKMQPAGGPRLTLSFEHPQPAVPADRSSNIDVTLVPELIAAAVMDSQKGEAMVGVGARGEVRLSLHDGLFHSNARLAFYIAARALVVGSETDPAGEAALGEYVYLTSRLRLGGEASLMLRRTDEFMDPSRSQHVILAHVYLGWAM